MEHASLPSPPLTLLWPAVLALCLSFFIYLSFSLYLSPYLCLSLYLSVFLFQYLLISFLITTQTALTSAYFFNNRHGCLCCTRPSSTLTRNPPRKDVVIFANCSRRQLVSARLRPVHKRGSACIMSHYGRGGPAHLCGGKGWRARCLFGKHFGRRLYFRNETRFWNCQRCR